MIYFSFSRPEILAELITLKRADKTAHKEADRVLAETILALTQNTTLCHSCCWGANTTNVIADMNCTVNCCRKVNVLQQLRSDPSISHYRTELCCWKQDYLKVNVLLRYNCSIQKTSPDVLWNRCGHVCNRAHQRVEHVCSQKFGRLCGCLWTWAAVKSHNTDFWWKLSFALWNLKGRKRKSFHARLWQVELWSPDWPPLIALMLTAERLMVSVAWKSQTPPFVQRAWDNVHHSDDRQLIRVDWCSLHLTAGFLFAAMRYVYVLRYVLQALEPRH